MSTTEPPRDWAAAEVAATIDHTLLKPEATPDQVQALCEEAAQLGTFSVCVSPSLVSAARAAVTGGVKVATVCGFPSGAHVSSVKAAEAATAVAAGADEVDMVVNLGAVKSGEFELVQSDIAAVVEASGDALVKVIIESAALTDDEIVACCTAAVAAGADFVKTSTGFHPAGGASEHAVALMRRTVGPGIGVKASGGIRTGADAVAMLNAGANRLGCSAGPAIVADIEAGAHQTGQRSSGSATY